MGAVVEGCEVQFVTVHGHRRAYVRKGPSGDPAAPVLLLLHGLACDHTDWDEVIDELATRYTVIAPDFLGHGQSDKPRADYSLGGYANGMRDLLTILGIDRVTVVGHSFGGGVAMQFAYQYPERTERIVLVASGGLGREVSPAIRAITLPGFYQAAGLVNLPGVRHVTQASLHALSHTGGPASRDFVEVARILRSLGDVPTRKAIRSLVRNVVDVHGQIVTMRDRAYLTEAMPMLVIWGANDPVLPVSHAGVAARLAPTARVEVIDKAGHFPQRDHPDVFVGILDDFVAGTEPAVYKRSHWRALLAHGSQDTTAEGKRRGRTVTSITEAKSARGA